jgi:hypothetical protein
MLASRTLRASFRTPHQFGRAIRDPCGKALARQQEDRS